MKTSVVKSIVVITGIFIFLSIGISFYIERDTKRFLQELGPPPILDSPSEPIAAGAKRTAVQDDRNLPIVVPTLEDTPQILETSPPAAGSQYLWEMEEDLEVEPEITEIEVEVESLDDDTVALPVYVEGPVEGIEFTGSPMDSFIDLIGSSAPNIPATEVVTDVLKKIEDGTATDQDMLDLTQAWLSILPEDDHANRASLVGFLNFQSDLMEHASRRPTRVISVEYTFDIYSEE